MATEYISREDALDAAWHNYYPSVDHYCVNVKCATRKDLEKIPTADVVEVVRCKDCKLMNHDEHGYWCINDYQASLHPEKDYCSRAVRRADNG